MSNMRFDKLAIPLKQDHPTTYKDCEWIDWNTDALNRKNYPTCRCGVKYVPIDNRNMCPMCWRKRKSQIR